LSERRAEAVATFLRAAGVADDRIRLRALDEGGSIDGMPDLWPQQRRVTVTTAPAPPRSNESPR
jgi:outer membrane protein OmpA-like peptidoglycan-associated protein